MKIRRLHSWDLTPTEAVALQRRLADRVEQGPPLARCDLVAGTDISYNRRSKMVYAGVVILRTADLAVVEQQGVVREVTFPYVPGLLSFREIPALLEVFAGIKSAPDAVMVDGHGYAHPRRFGLACHLGLCIGLPTVGCAKSRLIGEFQEPAPEAGAQTPLIHKGDVIGSVVRTRTGVQPVFVSVGNHIDLASAVRLVLRTCRGYRVPEPTRQAHLYVNRLRLAGSGAAEIVGKST
jgi:deoxyribonuclease V